MTEFTDEEYEAAVERGRVEFETKPHARTARYDRSTGMIVLELYNSCTFAVPARQLQGLENATDDQIADVELSMTGYGLHWEALDADLSVPAMLGGTFDADFTVAGLMAGRFGSRRYMAERFGAAWNLEAAE